MYSSDVFLSETEDRLNARYYGQEHVQLIRRMNDLVAKKGFNIETLDSISRKMKKGIFQIAASEYTTEGVPFVRVSDVKNMTIDMSEIAHITEQFDEKEKKTRMEPRDIVVSKGGTIGKIALIPSWNPRFNISQDIIGISVKKTSPVKSEYAATYLMSRLGKLQMERAKTQQMQPHLTLEYLKRLRIVYRKNELEDMVEDVDLAEKMNTDSYGKLKKALAIFHNTVYSEETKAVEEGKAFQIESNELDDYFTPRFYNPKYSQSLQHIKEKFESMPLNELADIRKGTEAGSKNYKNYLEKKDSDIPYVRTSDIVNWEIDLYSDYYVSESRRLTPNVAPNEIVFTKDGKIGFTALVTEEDRCIVSSGCAILNIPDENVFYVFLVLASELGVNQALQRSVVASTIPHLQSPERLGEISIPFIRKDIKQQVETLVKEAFSLKKERKKLVDKCLRKIESYIC